MKITITKSSPAKNDSVNELLWKILWAPIDLPRNIKDEFKLSGEEITLVAKNAEQLLGAIVSNQTDETEFELRHLAVNPDFQNQGVGKKLIAELEKELKEKAAETIQTIARNTSQSFFEASGFEKIEDYPDHPHFLKYGISFVLMKKKI